MIPSIKFNKIWSDDDLLEFEVTSSDGSSVFINQVYVGSGFVTSLVSELDIFKNHIYGGIYDLRLGEFGPEYANGAFHARLQFQERGKIFITLSAQSDFNDFGKKNVASESTLYLISEPALLDNFIEELRLFNKGLSSCFTLHGIQV